MLAAAGGVVTIVSFFKDLLVGFIVSVYLMATKELCAAHARKAVYSLFTRRQVYWVLRGAHKADVIFSGFVRGKLLDSLIMGILCFIGCSILNFPYTPLVAVTVGITNIIPFFGPFLGAIPSAFLILLASPMQALYFLIFILALQQLDGNVIGPKILGDKTGLPSLWVIVAILVGGSFFGLAGMFFGVPVFACLYSAANFFMDRRLRKKDLPTDTPAYAGREIVERDPDIPFSSPDSE
jgi:predicted PurR-regulated permease PerM